MHFVDTHCHLNLMKTNGNLELIIENAIRNGITRILVPGIDLESSIEAISISEKYDLVYAAIGIHPNDANKWDDQSFTRLIELSKHPKVKAIGEIGLDFYRDYSSHDSQKFVLSEQLRLSELTNLPVVIHSRDAVSEIMDILIKWKNSIVKRSYYGVMHSFEGNLQQAINITSSGFFIGIAGPITYKNAQEKHEIGRSLPLEKILLETDSPFLAPHPLRGKTNEPANIKLIAEKIASLTEMPLKLVQQKTTINANILFAWEH